jgi:hypothetical protein
MPSRKAGTTLRKKYGRTECPGTTLILFKIQTSKRMTPKNIDHHRKAAEHHEHAARHIREAANHQARERHQAARHHALLAFGQHLHATYHTEEAAKYPAKGNGTN